MDNLLIRALKKEDAEDVNRIYASIVKNSEKINFNRIIEEHSLAGCKASSFAAEFDGKVIGFIVSYILSGGFGIDKGAWIALIGVDPKYMGKGIGKSMAQKIFSHYKDLGINNVYTSVRWDSADLLSFFSGLNFDRSNFINLHKGLE